METQKEEIKNRVSKRGTAFKAVFGGIPGVIAFQTDSPENGFYGAIVGDGKILAEMVERGKVFEVRVPVFEEGTVAPDLLDGKRICGYYRSFKRAVKACVKTVNAGGRRASIDNYNTNRSLWQKSSEVKG